MKLVRIALLSTLLIAPSAQAQFYVEGAFGPGFTSQTGGSLVAKVPIEIDPDVPGPIMTTVNFAPAIGVGAALGYRFTRHFRTELNVYTQYDVMDPIDLPTIPDLFGIMPSKADLLTVTPMANFYFDYPICESPFTPYVGIGAGAVYTRVKTRTGTDLVVDDSDASLAVNVLGGVAVRIIDNLDATLGYRYLRTLASHSYDAVLPPDPDFPADPVRLLFRYDRLKFQMQSHQLTFGLRYTFGSRSNRDG